MILDIKIYALIFGLLAFLPLDVSAIWCFQCNSRHNPECATLRSNDTSNVFYKECRQPDFRMQNLSSSTPPRPDISQLFCRKIYQNIQDRDGLEIVVRKCGWILSQKKGDCYSNRETNHEEIVCQCFNDGCNSAGQNFLSAFTIATAFVVSLFHR